MKNTHNNVVNYIYGKNSVFEAISQNPKRINKIYFSQGINFDNKLKKINELAQKNSILIQFTNLNKFNKYFEIDEKKLTNINFQGVIASVSPVEYLDFEDFLNQNSNSYRKIVILDGVEDPHNFGAIIRTLAAASYDAVIVPKHRSCPISATVEKTSVGAINHIPVIKTNSLPAIVDTLKKNNWWIIAADGQSKDNYFDISYKDMNFAIILGAEGEGVSKTLLNKADFKVKIPSNFESLNVSAACAVIVYESIRQIHQM